MADEELREPTTAESLGQVSRGARGAAVGFGAVGIGLLVLFTAVLLKPNAHDDPPKIVPDLPVMVADQPQEPAVTPTTAYIPPAPPESPAVSEEQAPEAQVQERSEVVTPDIGQPAEPEVTETTQPPEVEEPGTTTTTCVPRPLGPNGERNPDYCY